MVVVMLFASFSADQSIECRVIRYRNQIRYLYIDIVSNRPAALGTDAGGRYGMCTRNLRRLESEVSITIRSGGAIIGVQITTRFRNAVAATD